MGDMVSKACLGEGDRGVSIHVEDLRGTTAAEAEENPVTTQAPLLPAPARGTFSVPQAGVELKVRSIRKMGWRPDLPDHRDRSFHPKAHSKVRDLINLPAAVDLRDQERFPVYNQGELGSCTANAIAACFQFQMLRQGDSSAFTPSRLFIYYNERAIEDRVSEDAGASIRDGIRSLRKLGVCSEASWPYVESRYTERPPTDCFASAKLHQAKAYARVEQTIDAMKACLAAGRPFVFGFTMYSDFYDAEVQRTGKMKWPPSGEHLGGHAVHACGYDDARKVFIVRNSWGDAWGDKGHFYMPYEYIESPLFASDFWVVKFVEDEEFPVQPESAP